MKRRISPALVGRNAACNAVAILRELPDDWHHKNSIFSHDHSRLIEIALTLAEIETEHPGSGFWNLPGIDDWETVCARLAGYVSALAHPTGKLALCKEDAS